MNETTNKSTFFHSLRQSLVVTLILLLLCGFVFPVLLSGISAVIFPSQAGGSLVYAGGQAVGSATVGQDFAEPYFMKGRPSACNYNTYSLDEQGNPYYNDGSEFSGLRTGSDNYAPSNPALTERVEADIEAFLEANPDVKREDIPADLMTASGSGLDPHITPESQKVTGLSVHFRQAGDLLSVFNPVCAILSPVLVSMRYHSAIRRRQICLH